MTRIHTLSMGIVAAAGLWLAGVAPLQAGYATTWVSGTGVDAGNCAITAPCATFQYAIGQTNAYGQINALTSGSYGPVNIDRPVSIIAQGVEALIAGSTFCNGSDAGICVKAGGNAIVSLRGLTVDLGFMHFNGITLVSAAALHVSDSHFRRGAVGIDVAPTTPPERSRRHRFDDDGQSHCRFSRGRAEAPSQYCP